MHKNIRTLKLFRNTIWYKITTLSGFLQLGSWYGYVDRRDVCENFSQG